MEKKPTSSTVIGLVISLILILFSLTLYFTGMFTSSWASYCGFVVLAGGILWAVINHGKETDHKATFGKLFGFGFKVTAVIIVIVILYTVLSDFIFPDIKRRIIETATEKALANPNVNEEQMRKGMEFFEKNYTLFIIVVLLFWYAIIGAIFSLIGAAVTKKKPQTPFENA